MNELEYGLLSDHAPERANNIINRTIFCRDNIDILRGINSECVDLIYLDPPFNKKKTFTAPIGSSARGASFRDIFKEEDLKDEWVQTIKEDHDKLHSFLNCIRDVSNRYNYCYLCYMAIRLIECHRVLKDTGSIYLHCDPTMSHYLKLLMDCVFGEGNFMRELIWALLNTSSGYKSKVKGWIRGHDTILFYTKSKDYTFNTLYQDHKEEYRARFKKVDENNRKYRDDRAGRRRQYLDETQGIKYIDTWIDIMSFQQNATTKEYVNYPTQKPLALLERIIKASSNKGDIVLDPFCGCATTCVAAEKLERQWVGIDISIKAYELVKARLKREVTNPENLFDYDKALTFSPDPPKRTDKGFDRGDKKYVYIIAHKNYPNEYKVGIASNWKSRLSSYQTSDPNRNFSMEYKILTENYREIEQHVHEVFENKHEWVHAPLQEIISKIKQGAPIKQPSLGF